MPINYKDYNPDWKETSKRVIAEAGDRCELCFAPNRAKVWRPEKNFISCLQIPWLREDFFAVSDHTVFITGKPDMIKMKKVKIILTVYHINGVKTDDSKHNLIALCQRCRLRLDSGKRFKKERW